MQILETGGLYLLVDIGLNKTGTGILGEAEECGNEEWRFSNWEHGFKNIRATHIIQAFSPVWQCL